MTVWLPGILYQEVHRDAYMTSLAVSIAYMQKEIGQTWLVYSQLDDMFLKVQEEDKMSKMDYNQTLIRY